MAFGIPDTANAAVAGQAEPDSVDFDAIAAGIAAGGVISGCAVTAQGTPNMTVAVAAGIVVSAAVPADVTAGNVTITAAHATLDRMDLIVASSAGVLSAVAGTATAAPVLMPTIPADSVLLAVVWVSAAVTSIVSNRITDKRIDLSAWRKFVDYLAPEPTLLARQFFK